VSLDCAMLAVRSSENAGYRTWARGRTRGSTLSSRQAGSPALGAELLDGQSCGLLPADPIVPERMEPGARVSCDQVASWK
jgi:hypothetical protein